MKEDAKKFAAEAHGAIKQVRKYTGEPYVNHVIAVANLVESYGGTDEMIAAAALHDVAEDVTPLLPTIYNIEVIRARFGDAVANMVIELTDVYTSENYPHINREGRKKLERERLAGISEGAKLIKLSDLTDNTKSIVEHDTGFARTYLKEKAALLPLLHSPYTEAAWQVADKQVADAMIQVVLKK
jgi:(p)ppGpp synthase/HD superfamily hydrolase